MCEEQEEEDLRWRVKKVAATAVEGPMLRWHFEIQIQMVWLGLGRDVGLELEVEIGLLDVGISYND